MDKITEEVSVEEQPKLYAVKCTSVEELEKAYKKTVPSFLMITKHY